VALFDAYDIIMSNTESLLLYPNEARKLIGVKSTKFYELVKLPDFPKPRCPLGGKRPMYLRSEIEEWANNIAVMSYE